MLLIERVGRERVALKKLWQPALAFIRDENNRKLMSWLAAAILGFVGLFTSAIAFFSKPDPISLDLIRQEVSIDDPVCGGVHIALLSEQEVSKDGCPMHSATMVIEPDQGLVLDVVVRNNDARPVLFSNIGVLITTARQTWHPPGGGVGVVETSADIVLEQQVASMSTFLERSCDASKFRIFETISPLPVERRTVEVSNGSSRVICKVRLPFRNGRFEVSEENRATCREKFGSACDYLTIGEFEIEDQIELRQQLIDPISLEPNEFFRISLTWPRYGGYPNNMIGKISINNGTYLSEPFSIRRQDYGRIWYIIEN